MCPSPEVSIVLLLQETEHTLDTPFVSEAERYRREVTGLERRWKSLFHGRKVSREAVESEFQGLVDSYENDERRFFGIRFLTCLFSVFDKVHDALEDKQSVAFAIFFHKFVFDRTFAEGDVRSNESESACAMRTTLTEMQVSEEIIGRAEDLILTQRRDADPTITNDSRYFLDIRNSIRGFDIDDYVNQSAEPARAEHESLTDEAYIEMRLKELQNMLEQESLFLTKEVRALFETEARNNIQFEIETLRGF